MGWEDGSKGKFKQEDLSSDPQQGLAVHICHPSIREVEMGILAAQPP